MAPSLPGHVPSWLPNGLAALAELALDLRWTWSHAADVLWQRIDPKAWDQSGNAWTLLQGASAERLSTLAADPVFTAELRRLTEARTAYAETPGWFTSTYGDDALRGVAYFSMEFGLGEALPLYAGGLGVLAGDVLKTASDLGIPMVGIGLLYDEGYFRQVIDAAGWQHEIYPFNDPATLPIRPALDPGGAWLQIPLSLPGRTLVLRVWHAQVGRVPLYLLDANNPINAAADRGITARLYQAGQEIRLLQELVLGVGGWRVVEALAPATEICHMNEGHAAFAAVERARSVQRRSGLSFWEAFAATRAGNVFTTHTPVAAGFDRFSPSMIGTYARHFDGFLDEIGVPLEDILALGRARPADTGEPFNMAYLAMRGAAHTVAVSRQHERVSRQIFQPLFPRWPEHEVPVGHITNGVHVPSWDSVDADRLWTAACGKERWRCAPDSLHEQVAALDDETLWAMRGAGRNELVKAARRRLARQLESRGETADTVAIADQTLDANVLTLGFARRFATYKRPNLLLHDPPRLRRLLTDPQRPVQLILAGKAHPADDDGKRMIHEWIELEREPALRRCVVFLDDYDLPLAQEMVQGVDVWINTPRRPWEACGTSGMKVLVNGGLNLSVLDGWWEEAYDPDVGWAIANGAGTDDAERDRHEAEALYALLEDAVVPEFYCRDESGLPRQWLGRVRRSLSRLTPAYSTNRMLQQQIEQTYLPAVTEYRSRIAGNAAGAAAIRDWECRLRRGWPLLHIGEPVMTGSTAEGWHVSVPVYLGDIGGDAVRVEIYAEQRGELEAVAVALRPDAAIPGSLNGHIYTGSVPAGRSAEDYTIRVVPNLAGVAVPAELNLILWQR